MYSILIQNDNAKPFVISQNSNNYFDYITSNYQVVATGTKKEMYSLIEEVLTAYAD